MSPRPDAIAPEKRAEIAARLDEIVRDSDVRILFAAESGSRAWGFPSPDSDYDVRFVYVHCPEWYLSIRRRRDVIELPLEEDLDINGWDLRKALQLLVKPNPVLLEWLCSPILYRVEPAAMELLRSLARRVAHQRPSSYHYLHLAESQYRRFIAGKPEVALKKYFYALRPALALRWLRVRPEDPVPMALPELRAGIDLPPEVGALLDALLLRKAQSKEMGAGSREGAFDSLIEAEIDAARESLAENNGPGEDLLEAADEVFRTLVVEDLPCS